MLSLRNLPPSFRTLFSSFLIVIGIGYLSALSYLFLVDVEPHRQTGQGLVQGIGAKYHGSASGSRLEAALRGTMAGMVTSEERDRIVQWAQAGAAADGYASIEPIITQKCGTCHSPRSAMSIAPLTSLQEIQKLVNVDAGLSL